MSMKKTDIEKALAKKITGRMAGAGVAGRFAQGAATVADKREQRRRDSAAGLVPFACKLPQALVNRIQERAAAHAGGVNGLMAEWVEQGLK